MGPDLQSVNNLLYATGKRKPSVDKQLTHLSTASERLPSSSQVFHMHEGHGSILGTSKMLLSLPQKTAAQKPS